MLDLVYLSGTIVFFVAALAYVRFCERLRKGEREDEY